MGAVTIGFWDKNESLFCKLSPTPQKNAPPNAPKSGKKKKKNAPLSFFATLATPTNLTTSKIAALTFVPKLGLD